MIRYTLQCDEAHAFEAWFKSSAAFDRQAKRGLISCPTCGSVAVEKAIMAPAIARRDRQPATTDVAVKPAASLPVVAGSPGPVALPKELLDAIRNLREAVEKNAENVGDKFAEEARKIHYDEAPARGIYGQATSDEVGALIEEGIEVHPLPILPEDRN